MTEAPERVIDPTESQLPAVRANGAPVALAPAQQAPTVESMIVTAIERGTAPETLEKLVALAERVKASQAAQAFNAAMAAFRSECPTIGRNREATDPKKDNKVLYRFADLSHITKIIDPVLLKHGLSYKWDSSTDAGQTVITCTVRHVDGHSESSRFECKGSGTSIMNAAQVAASATTFGRRYSLLFALGLTIDGDDDGRNAVPRDQPDADPSQPTVLPRAERQAQPPDDGTPRVTRTDLGALATHWRRKFNRPTATTAEFAEWARGVLGTDADLTHVRNWTVDALEVCREALK